MSTSHQDPDSLTAVQKILQQLRGRCPDWDIPSEFDSASEIWQWATENDLVKTPLLESIAAAIGIPFYDSIDDRTVDSSFVAKVPIQIARKFLLLGMSADDDDVDLAAGSLEGLHQADNISRLLQRPTRVFFADPEAIESAINQAYQQRSSQTETTIRSLEDDDATIEITKHEDLLDVSGKSSVVYLVNSVLFDAVQMRASDIHIQPYESHLQIRFRIDGVLFDQFEVPKNSQEEVLSRTKVISQMDIAEKRLPQDGRATIRVGDRVIDLRVASLPTSYGERIVIRLLDKSSRMFTLDELGMSPTIHQQFRQVIQQEHGLILVTGPTGNGKSTTLYAALEEINTTDRNVVTLEDPIEYQLPGISQTQINEKKGMTFGRGLRNVLRQDPDIIMVGEIRDHETAEMAIQSALTGHMVFSTLHTNDAPGSITRLLDLNIEPYLVSSSTVAVLAQRLVRRICSDCRQPADDPESISKLGVSVDQPPPESFVGRGCENCRDTGYRGRIGLFELMIVDDDLQKAIQQRQDASLLRAIAIKQGMQILRQDGLAKVAAGQTTVAEVLRVTGNSA